MKPRSPQFARQRVPWVSRHPTTPSNFSLRNRTRERNQVSHRTPDKGNRTMSKRGIGATGVALIAFSALVGLPDNVDACSACFEEELPDGSWVGWCVDSWVLNCSEVSIGGETVSCASYGTCWPAVTFHLDGSPMGKSGAPVAVSSGLILGSSHEVTCSGDVVGRYYDGTSESAVRAATRSVGI